MVGLLAKSKAGHDKEHIYVIIKADKEYVYLADGRTKTYEMPKKKKYKHVQINNSYENGLVSMLEAECINQNINVEIKRAIKLYEAGKKDLGGHITCQKPM